MREVDKILNEMLATINAATPEPWYEEGGDVRYDCSPSTTEEGHSDCTIQICEVNRVDEKLDSFKNNRTFITQSRTDWERTVRALQRVLAEVKRSTDKDFYEHCCGKVGEILNGKV